MPRRQQNFDRYKLTARMRMIVEFHAAAAAAEIKLAGEIWRMKRGLPASASAPQAEEKSVSAKATAKAAGKAKAKEDEPTPRKKPSQTTTKAGQSRRGIFSNDDDDAHSSDGEEDGEAIPTKAHRTCPRTPACNGRAAGRKGCGTPCYREHGERTSPRGQARGRR